jgi:hypothetical protein
MTRLLWNSKVHYVFTGPYPQTNESSPHPHIRTCFFKTYFNIILPSTLRPKKCSLYVFRQEFSKHFWSLPFVLRVLFNFSAWCGYSYAWWLVHILKLLIMQVSTNLESLHLFQVQIFSTLGPTLFSNTPQWQSLSRFSHLRHCVVL